MPSISCACLAFPFPCYFCFHGYYYQYHPCSLSLTQTPETQKSDFSSPLKPKKHVHISFGLDCIDDDECSPLRARDCRETEWGTSNVVVSGRERKKKRDFLISERGQRLIL